jgi:hypothetical protein
MLLARLNRVRAPQRADDNSARARPLPATGLFFSWPSPVCSRFNLRQVVVRAVGDGPLPSSSLSF